MAAVDPASPELSQEQMRAEFRHLLAETSHEHAQARRADAQGYKAWQEGRLYPFVVFGAGSVFTLVLGAIIAALLHWLGVPVR